jgi:hypothetical protein
LYCRFGGEILALKRELLSMFDNVLSVNVVVKVLVFCIISILTINVVARLMSATLALIIKARKL